jgi:hypothetical protein
LKRKVHSGWRFVGNCLVCSLFIRLLVTDVEGAILLSATHYSQFGGITNTDNLIPMPERVDK